MDRGADCETRPLQNAPFCLISASGSNFNPRNTPCIPVVKIIAFLELKQKLTFFKGLGDIRNRDLQLRGSSGFSPLSLFLFH
jgi:hypothetical protein